MYHAKTRWLLVALVLLAGATPAWACINDLDTFKQERQFKSLCPDAAQLRPSFEMNLDKGLRYQKAYQDYEAQRIKEGASIDDERFFDAFDAEHGAIASPVGDEDRFLAEDAPARNRTPPIGIVLLSTGVFAFLGALLIRWRDSRLTV